MYPKSDLLRHNSTAQNFVDSCLIPFTALHDTLHDTLHEQLSFLTNVV